MQCMRIPQHLFVENYYAGEYTHHLHNCCIILFACDVWFSLLIQIQLIRQNTILVHLRLKYRNVVNLSLFPIILYGRRLVAQ